MPGLGGPGTRVEMIWLLQWAARQPMVDIFGVAALAPLLRGKPVIPKPGSGGRAATDTLDECLLGLTVQQAPSKLSDHRPVDPDANVDTPLLYIALQLLILSLVNKSTNLLETSLGGVTVKSICSPSGVVSW